MSITTALLLGGLSALVAGAWLLKRGRWPRRVGDTPHCRGCDYVLVGLDLQAAGARCPECGHALTPSQIRTGERPRRRWLTAIAIVLLLLGLGTSYLGVHDRLPRIDWYHYRPFALVLRDLDSSGTDILAAWELDQRYLSNRLSVEQSHQVVDRILKKMLTGMLKPPGLAQRVFVLVLKDMIRNGEITQAQMDLLLRSLVQVTVIQRDGYLQVNVHESGSLRTDLGLDRQTCSLRCDGQVVSGYRAVTDACLASEPPAHVLVASRLQPGRHVITVTEIFKGKPNALASRPLETPSPNWGTVSISVNCDVSEATNAVPTPEQFQIHTAVNLTIPPEASWADRWVHFNDGNFRGD